MVVRTSGESADAVRTRPPNLSQGFVSRTLRCCARVVWIQAGLTSLGETFRGLVANIFVLNLLAHQRHGTCTQLLER